VHPNVPRLLNILGLRFEMLRVSDFHVSPAFRFSALGCEERLEETAELGQSKELVKGTP
jgi:hypothetical protein